MANVARADSKKMPGFVAGNKVEMFSDDKASLAGMLKDVKAAKSKIQFESFLFNGEDGGAIADALIQKQKQGIKVEVLLDKKAQKLDDEKLADKLREGGVEVRYYDTSKLKMSAIAVDHTKLAVFDGKIGWEGGANFDTEINRDLMSRIQGPAVRDVQKIFVDAWNLAGAKEKKKIESLDPVPAIQGDVFIRVTETSPGKDTSHEATLQQLKDLKKGDSLDLWMMDLGDHDVIAEMLAAKKRGVELRVMLDYSAPFADKLGPAKKVAEKLVGGTPDLYAVTELQKAGVDVRYYRAPEGITKLHSKVAIFTYHDQVKKEDGTTESVPRRELMTGSTNWIKGAFEFNHEMAATMKGGDVGDRVLKFFEQDWKDNSYTAPKPKGFLDKIKTNLIKGLTDTFVMVPGEENVRNV